MDSSTVVSYGLIGGAVVGVIGLIIFAIAKAGVDLWTLFVGIQITIVAIALLFGGFVSLKDAAEAPSFTFQVARASIVYLPISLGMFSVLGSVLFENGNFLIPVIAGLGAVALNYVLDAIGTSGGSEILKWLGTGLYDSIIAPFVALGKAIGITK
jgi:hypothetical protein